MITIKHDSLYRGQSYKSICMLQSRYKAKRTSVDTYTEPMKPAHNLNNDL